MWRVDRGAVVTVVDDLDDRRYVLALVDVLRSEVPAVSCSSVSDGLPALHVRDADVFAGATFVAKIDICGDRRGATLRVVGLDVTAAVDVDAMCSYLRRVVGA